MSGLITRARILRATIENLATTLNDETAADNAELFPKWSGDGVSYVTGDRIRYEGILYKVLMNHTSQEEWTPESAPSLYARVLIPDPQRIYPWIQPDSTNGYHVGDKVYYPDEGDPIYISLIDNNVWPPTEAVAWELFDDDDDDDEPTPTPDPEPTPEPEPTPDPEPEPDDDEIPEWVTPTATEFYSIGDKVHYRTFDDPVYECLIDNCVWSPEELPSAWRLIDE